MWGIHVISFAYFWAEHMHWISGYINTNQFPTIQITPDPKSCMSELTAVTYYCWNPPL